MNGHVFISHSSRDDDFVKELRAALEGLGLSVWDDSHELIGGSRLAPEVEEAIARARQLVAVISPNTVNSPWAHAEIQKAQEVEGERKDEGYRVIPLLLPGVEPSILGLWFNELQGLVPIRVGEGGVREALPDILAALGERPPEVLRTSEAAPQHVEELILKLDNLNIESRDGKRRASAVARLLYDPAHASAPPVESRPFKFTAPLGVIEAEELRWYLEEYYVWPIGIFQERAARIEERLPEWGHELYRAAFDPRAAPEALGAWQEKDDKVERRFSVFVDRDLPGGSSEDEQAAADEAAAELLALPWELLHDGRGFLFHGPRPVRVRRRLPNRHPQPVIPTRLPIRILLVSPRPESEAIPYLDHRVSAKPVVEALESLGELAKLSTLTPPTFPALERALREADERGEPFDVFHFDGHGVYDPRAGLGALCFEEPNDEQESGPRAVDLVDAERLAGLMRDRRIPLVFLEACQTAKTEGDPTASVAAKLLEEGIASVVAMSHMVLVETARRFVKSFYKALAEGRRVGTAMIEGQRELERDDYRGKLMGAGDLRLKDWFVPVLYQEEQDPRLVTRLPPAEVQELQARQRRLSLGRLPDPPPHDFHGRSRELLALERLLTREPFAVIRGRGGEGKTTLAVELARWLVRTARFQRAAFVSFEQYTDARGLLDSLGQQLLPEGDGYSVASYTDLSQAFQPVERALRDRPTIIVLDNLESVLPDREGQPPPGAAPIQEIFTICLDLLNASPSTRIVFTTREPMPAPFDGRGNEIFLPPLRREDAVALVGEVMKRHGITPKPDDLGADPREITELVEAVDCHARALVLLAGELALTGVRGTAENLYQLMAGLDRKYPQDGENSFYASVELSLRRLPPETRERLKPLSVFYGGAHILVLAQMLGAEQEEAVSLARQLIEVGLADDAGYGHLRLDPALPSYLLRGISEDEQERLRAGWAEGMGGLASMLYQQRFENAELSSRLTRLESPNLLAALLWMQERANPDAVVTLAQDLETLFSGLGLQQAVTQATRVREQAAQHLRQWSRAQYLSASAGVERLLERGDVQAANAAAQALLSRCLEAGGEAYEGANYDTAGAHFTLGRVLQTMGGAEDAIPILNEATKRFQTLAEEGDISAELMASVAVAAIGDCLRDSGRLEEAAAAYENSIAGAERLGNRRQVAAVSGQLGTVSLLLKDFDRALRHYSESRAIFESLGEPSSVATAWHQTGVTYRQAGLYSEAERALRQALAIKVQNGNVEGEAGTLSELAVLYFELDRLEESVKCYRQAADIFVKLGNQFLEGAARNNLAILLLVTQRYDEAQKELMRSFECREGYGHAAQRWKTWNVFYRLEQLYGGNPERTAEARRRAIESFAEFRRAGGQNLSPGAELCARVAAAIASGETAGVQEELLQYLGADAESWAKVMIPKLQAVILGERHAELTNDPGLDYDDAVELGLLVEHLQQT